MRDHSGNKGIPRPVEVFLAAAGLLFFSPLLLLIALLVKTTSKGTILFRQKRVGISGKEFVLYKFRSMISETGSVRLTSENDPRLTVIGIWLRRYKLDELPQLWNVLRGDMALVGPRPEVAEFVDLSTPLWIEILTVRPGITDPVSLRLRNEEKLLAAVEDKETFYRRILLPFKLHGWSEYVQRKNFSTDLIIIFETFKAIILAKDASPPTLEELGRID